MTQLNKKEKQKILEFSKNYIHIHKEITDIEKEIKELEKNSNLLISELESCRKKEVDFISKLEIKYGPGRLNPMTLCWETKKIEEKNEVLN